MPASLFRLNAFALLVLLGFSSNTRAALYGTVWDLRGNFTVGSGDYIRMTGDGNGDSFKYQDGYFYHNDSTMDFWQNAQIGLNNWAVFYQNGGQMNVGGWLSIARYGGSGYLEVNGGTVNSYNHQIIVGEVGYGSMTMNGGYAYTYQGVTLGQNGGSTGNLSLNGGTLEAGVIWKGGGTGNLGFNGGTLKATHDEWNFISGLNSANINGSAGIDNNGKGIGINQTLTGSGGLYLYGGGTTYLRQGNQYTGGTFINAGTLDFRGDQSYSSQYTIGNGARLNVTSDSTWFYNAPSFNFTSSGNGNITADSGNFIMSANTSYTTAGGARNLIDGSRGINLNGYTATFDVVRGTDANTDLSVSTVLWNSGGMVKNGNGIMKMSGVNSYSGETKVIAGTLMVDTGGSIATSSATVSSGATLKVNGAAGAVVLNGILSGTGTVGALTVKSGGVVKITTASTSTTSTTTASTSTATAWDTGGSINFNSGSIIDATGLSLSQQPYVLIRGSSVTGTPTVQGATGFTVSSAGNMIGLTPTVDTDGDGLTDYQESQLGTNPNIVDTDSDTLLDGAEVALGTNPTNPDTDGDKVPDGIEVTNGTSPLNSASNPLPAITTQLLGGTKNQGDGFTFMVNATDPTATFLFYQWKKNGVNLGIGTYDNFLTISSLQLSDAGNYEVIVSNPLGSTTSSVVTLVVVNQPPVILSRFAVGFNEDGTSKAGWTGVGPNDTYGPDKPSFSNSVLVATATGSSSLGSTSLMAGTYTVQFAHGLPFANATPGTLTVSAEAVADGSSTPLSTLGRSEVITLRTDTTWTTDSFTFTIPAGNSAVGKYLKLTFNHSKDGVWHSIDSISVSVSGSSTLSIPGLTEDVTGNLLFSGTPFYDVGSSSLTVTLSVDAGTITGNAGTGITVGGTATARTFAGTLADLNAYFITPGKITYLAPQDFNGSKTLGILVSDGQLTATGSATINVQPSNDAPTLVGISNQPIAQESFASATLLTGSISGNASISGGECILTPALSGRNGYLFMNNLGAASPTAFSAQFDYRAFDGNGADGTSFSYGNPAGGIYSDSEYGIKSGLAVRLIEYARSRVEVAYNGIVLTSVDFALWNANYRTVVIQVDELSRVSVSIGGTPVVSNISLPAAYATADKSAWQFVFAARCGGANNKHSLKNLSIQGVSRGIPTEFTVTEDVLGNLLFPGNPFADMDSTNLTVTLSVEDGTITGSSGEGVTVGGTGTARTFAGTVDALNSYFTTPGRISYLGASNNATARQMTITAADGVSATSQSVGINFTPVNDAPVLAEILGSYSGVFNQPQTIPLSASDLETPIAQLVFTVSSSNPTLFPNGSMNVARLGMAWELVATPATGQSGDADITVTVSDGNGALASRTFHITVNAALISSGFSHTLYLGAGATTVTAWGLNTDGRLGVGDMNSPVNWAEAVDGIPAGATVEGLAAGGTHSLILANGKVYAAGSDRFGQLGQGGTSRINQSSFIQVFAPTSRVVAVSAGGNHSLAVTESGKVFACGDNTYGQLGDSKLVSSPAWVEVSFKDPVTGLSPEIVSVVAGADHNLAVDEDGGVWVWGRNNYGQLGIGKRSLAERTPSELNLGAGVFAESVAAGFSHSLILTTDGKVLGFGRNNSGQTGQSATSSVVLVPTLISGLSEIRLISAGTDSSFAINQSGRLYSWGYNSYGELLLGYASPAVYGPAPSPICDNVSVVSGGGYSSLAWGAQGLVFGGRNDVGQAGNGPDPDEVVGDYTYTGVSLTLANLTMDLAGTIEDPLYDKIFAGSGAVTLNGIVNLMFVGTYTGPVYGTPQTFDLIWAKNGITLGANYKLAFNQAGYLVESAVVDKIVKGVSGKVLQATVGAVVNAADLAKAVNLAKPSLDQVQSVSYGGSPGVGIRTLSVSSGVEMIYSYTRPTGGVMSGAEYFFDGYTYRVEYTASLDPELVDWNPAVVTGTTITPLGDGYERATLRISATGSLGFLRLTMVNPQATGISAGVGSATSSAGAGSATSN